MARTILKSTAVRVPVAWVLVQLEPFFAVLAASNEREAIDREFRALFAARQDDGGHDGFELAIRLAPIVTRI